MNAAHRQSQYQAVADSELEAGESLFFPSHRYGAPMAARMAFACDSVHRPGPSDQRPGPARPGRLTVTGPARLRAGDPETRAGLLSD